MFLSFNADCDIGRALLVKLNRQGDNSVYFSYVLMISDDYISAIVYIYEANLISWSYTKMTGKCRFQDRWLHEKEYKDCLLNIGSWVICEKRSGISLSLELTWN